MIFLPVIKFFCQIIDEAMTIDSYMFYQLSSYFKSIFW